MRATTVGRHGQAGRRRAASWRGTPAASRARRGLPSWTWSVGEVRIARDRPGDVGARAGRVSAPERPRAGRDSRCRLAGRLDRPWERRSARPVFARRGARLMRLGGRMLLRTAAAKGCYGVALPPHQRHRDLGLRHPPRHRHLPRRRRPGRLRRAPGLLRQPDRAGPGGRSSARRSCTTRSTACASSSSTSGRR